MSGPCCTKQLTASSSCPLYCSTSADCHRAVCLHRTGVAELLDGSVLLHEVLKVPELVGL